METSQSEVSTHRLACSPIDLQISRFTKEVKIRMAQCLFCNTSQCLVIKEYRTKSFLLLVFITIMMVYLGTIQFQMFIPKEPWSEYQTCENVLYKMVRGDWKQRVYNKTELDQVQTFMSRTRNYHRLPPSLQRSDNKCGNVTMTQDKRTQHLQWWRGLCDPLGHQPCCYNNQCAVKSVEECTCPQCYDIRQPKYAELHTWTPDDQNCQVFEFIKEEDTCKLLNNMTMYFIGDSLIRQFFVSVLGFLRINKPNRQLRENLTPDLVKKCDKYYTYFTDCNANIIYESHECNNKVVIKVQELWRASMAVDILKLIGQLTGVPNSLVVFGIGLHDNLNYDVIVKKVLNPLFNLLSKSPWPRLIWIAPHPPGIMKTPFKQQKSAVLSYNARIKDLMAKRNIPVIDFENVTKGIMSYDGTHFGKGVNDVKAQIFFNYILEQRATSNSSLFPKIT